MTTAATIWGLTMPADAPPPVVPSMTAATPLTKPGAAAYARELTKCYSTGTARVTALDGVDIHFRHGELTAVMGPEGSGRTTLLRTMAGLEPATSGSVHLAGVDLSTMDDEQRMRMSRDCAALLTPDGGVVPALTVAENISLATAAAGQNIGKEWFDLVADCVGLRDVLDEYPSQLPASVRPRILLAKALLARPRVIFADDPISGLDPHAVVAMLDALRRAVDVLRQSIVMVVSEPVAAAYCDRVFLLDEGRVVDEIRAPSAHRVLERTRQLDMAHAH